MVGDTLKRKHGPFASSSRKKIKRTTLSGRQQSTTVSVNDLPWKSSQSHLDIGGFGDEAEGGMLMLEEVEDVEVVYGKSEGGKVVGFKLLKDSKKVKEVAPENAEVNDAYEGPALPKPIVLDCFDPSTLLPSWTSCQFHTALLQSIQKRGFEHPTEIQKRTWEVFFSQDTPEEKRESQNDEEGNDEEEPLEPKRRDIVGIAQTGSGKTLAYGLPILHHIISSLSSFSSTNVTVTPPSTSQRRPLQALVLAPTRELALQVSDHLNACLDQLFATQSRAQARDQEDKKASNAPIHKPPPPISVAAIVGGMSAQKQRRILSRGVDVLVATPGRLWDLCGEPAHLPQRTAGELLNTLADSRSLQDRSLAAQFRSLRFLVLDEADRMVEAGHFQELDSILRMTARPPPDVDIEATSQDPPAPLDLDSGDMAIVERNDALQTFIFSATMSKDLQRDLKRGRGCGTNEKKRGESATTLDDLLLKLDFRDPDPVIIDLSPEGGRVESLQESKVECLMNDKDVYLYYFLLRYPGRSLVFLSSIDGIRRLMPVLELLRLHVWPLHSGLQQKQRLKNLDRFKSMANSVLLATDIAARGLDIPAVDHVIHYQVPRAADAYVHRNGRTARAMRKGFGLVLCAPDERRVFRGVLAGLGREGDDVPELKVEHDLLDKLKGRVQLARKIDTATHRDKKEKHDRNWMRETAEAMEIELASDFESDASEDAPKASMQRSRDVQVTDLKAELKQALSQPLIARGISTRYITSGTRPIVDDLVGGDHHETILGLKKTEAGHEVVKKKKRKIQKNSNLHRK